jgi:lipopolysaccharide/colanic/teichoic acid biosynthesis glycosyltransferase
MSEEKNSGKQVFIAVSKRALDIVGGTFLFIVTSWLVLIAALVKFFEDFHNPFCAVKRVSVKGKEYKHFKIRTMCIHAEELEKQLIEAGLNEAEPPAFKMENDPRITPVGKFLRRYYVDRFPAFLNVIAGQITLKYIFTKRVETL